MKKKKFYFFDWCPVPHIHYRGCDVLDDTKLEKDAFSSIIFDGNPIVENVTYVRRRDGFFLFSIQFTTEFLARDVVDWARSISSTIKSEAFSHVDIYHAKSENELGSEYSTVPHNAVLLEDISSSDFVSRLKCGTEADHLHQKLKLLDEVIASTPVNDVNLFKNILLEDYFLFCVNAIHKNGNASNRRACLVLEYHQSKKKDEFITRLKVSEQEAKLSDPFRKIVTLVVAILAGVFLMYSTPVNGTSKEYAKYLAVVLGGFSVGLLIWHYYETNVKFLPLKLRLESLKGYLSTCAICSSNICSVSNNANTFLKHKRDGSVVGDPYVWTLASLDPLLDKYLARQQNFATNIMVFFAFIAVVVGIVAVFD